VQIIRTVAEMTAARDAMPGSVGLVPTMGFLHEGHLSLVRRARTDNDHVIVTIFVNPTQFGPGEDLERYPRDEQRDLGLLERERADVVFIPSADEIYPPGFADWVEVTGPIAERLEGAHRPGHFRGVTTVCARLFRITRPHRAYFGQKDAQQLRIIRRMVQEQGLPVDIIPMPIVREPDGLAMSSRNVYLSPEERALALRLSQSLRLAERLVTGNGTTDAETIRQAVREIVLPSPGVEDGAGGVGRGAGGEGSPDSTLTLDYVSVADEQTLEEVDVLDRPALILLAVRIRSTRLIDNTVIMPAGSRAPDLQSFMIGK
jgi:pantoate--beta-alanine ligase